MIFQKKGFLLNRVKKVFFDRGSLYKILKPEAVHCQAYANSYTVKEQN
jgi:hypothetical protein